MKTLLILALILVMGSGMAIGQEVRPVQHTFGSLEEIIAYSEETNLDLVIDNIRYIQATKAKKASRIEILNPTTSLSGSFTHFKELPVTLLPAEIFGGEPGTTVELRAGSPYTTEFSQNLEVQLVNPVGWADYKLAKINTELTRSSGQRTRQVLHENLADSYYAIVNLNKQRVSTEELLKSADSVYVITQNKFDEGLVSQQDLNNAEVNKLNTEKNLRQIEYLLADSHLTLKTLCTIPEQDEVVIKHTDSSTPERQYVALNKLDVKIQLLNLDFARQNYKKSRSVLLPSLSFFTGNTYQLNNTTFQPLSGNWINSNYLGLTLSFRLPNSSTFSNMQQAKLDYEIASREMEKAEHAAQIEQKRLANSYEEARSEHKLALDINSLHTDTYEKNLNLYGQGLISVDRLLDSYNAMLNAEYAANSAAISLELAHSKIAINNTFN
ncbi:MAG: TolC family protein [Rhodothermaceae bacterium]|nr:TolC family protein [Rhodothermaceae bacterium]